MKIFGFLLIIISILLVGLGVTLITLSVMNFTITVFSVLKIIVGSILSIGGIVMFYVDIRLIILERMQSNIDNRKK